MAQFRPQTCHLYKYVLTTYTAKFPCGTSTFFFELTNLYPEDVHIHSHYAATSLFCCHGKLPTCRSQRYKLLYRQM